MRCSPELLSFAQLNASPVSQPRNLIHLFGYSWLDHEELTAPKTASSDELLQWYLASDDFGTNFLGGDPRAPDVHGPFPRQTVTVDRLLFIDRHEFLRLTEEALIPPSEVEGWETDPRHLQATELLRDLSARHSWFWHLTLNETDRGLMHEYGAVLTYFREFICGSPDCGRVERDVIGED
jgi:hypothetical protein